MDTASLHQIIVIDGPDIHKTVQSPLVSHLYQWLSSYPVAMSPTVYLGINRPSSFPVKEPKHNTHLSGNTRFQVSLELTKKHSCISSAAKFSLQRIASASMDILGLFWFQLLEVLTAYQFLKSIPALVEILLFPQTFPMNKSSNKWGF